jgi:hypothetical protein
MDLVQRYRDQHLPSRIDQGCKTHQGQSQILTLKGNLGDENEVQLAIGFDLNDTRGRQYSELRHLIIRVTHIHILYHCISHRSQSCPYNPFLHSL